MFDGMGGENYGEKAAYAVAQEAEKAAEIVEEAELRQPQPYYSQPEPEV